MMLLVLIFGGLLGWGLVFWVLDRPTVPAYKVVDMYRYVTICLVAVLVIVGFKMIQYRTELVTLYSANASKLFCR